MKTLADFLTESEDKNLHLEHLEDLILNQGVSGVRKSIQFLLSLRDMLSGHSKFPVNITTKWDGAPAIFAGTNPDNGKFFVGTKSVFAKNAKLNYTEKDIAQNHESTELQSKLRACLRHLPKLGIKGILQGDLLFTKGSTEVKEIDGQKYVTFMPNTITYAIPLHTPLADRIQQAELGIVFHTEYNGQSMDTLKASFKIDIGYLHHTKEVWFRDASFVDESGTVTLTAEEAAQVTGLLSIAGRLFQGLDPKVLNQIALNETYRLYVKTFNNSVIRSGEGIKDTAEHTNAFIRWLDAKMTAAIREAKKPETQQKRIQEKTLVLGFFRNHILDLKRIFDLQNVIVYAKIVITHKLSQVRGTHTFLKTSDGYKVTRPEGFVAIDHIGNAVKLVDRLEFSHANFNISKNWEK